MKVTASQRLIHLALSGSPKTVLELMDFTGSTFQGLAQLLRPLIAAGYIECTTKQPVEMYRLACTPLQSSCTVPIPDEVFEEDGKPICLGDVAQEIMYSLYETHCADGTRGSFAPAILADRLGIDEASIQEALIALRGRGLINQESWYVLATSKAISRIAEERQIVDYAIAHDDLPRLMATREQIVSWVAPDAYVRHLQSAQVVAA